jgi:CBS domain-containing protein
MISTHSLLREIQSAPDIPQSETLFTKVRERINVVFSTLEKRREGSLETQDTREARAKTRLDLQTLIADLEYRTARTAIILGTKGEQEEFLQEVTDLLQNPGILTNPLLKTNLEILVSTEVTRGMARARRHGLSNSLDIIEPGDPRLSADMRFNNPLLEGRTAIVPIDLHLSFNPEHTVGYALDRASGQYKGRFNAIIVLDGTKHADKTPRGMLRLSTLAALDPNLPLSAVMQMDIDPPFATHNTPRAEVELAMHTHGVNLWPVTDATNGEMIGTITQESVVVKELRYNSARSTLDLSTKIGEQTLRSEIWSNEPYWV